MTTMMMLPRTINVPMFVDMDTSFPYVGIPPIAIVANEEVCTVPSMKRLSVSTSLGVRPVSSFSFDNTVVSLSSKSSVKTSLLTSLATATASSSSFSSSALSVSSVLSSSCKPPPRKSSFKIMTARKDTDVDEDIFVSDLKSVRFSIVDENINANMHQYFMQEEEDSDDDEMMMHVEEPLSRLYRATSTSNVVNDDDDDNDNDDKTDDDILNCTIGVVVNNTINISNTNNKDIDFVWRWATVHKDKIQDTVPKRRKGHRRSSKINTNFGTDILPNLQQGRSREVMM